MSNVQTKKDGAHSESASTKGEESYNIILLDDDRFLLDMYCMKFSQEGHRIAACITVDEVLTTLRGGFKADAVVFDLIMPERDGFELLRVIKEEKLAEGAALIVFTNQGEDEEKQKTEELGADAYIIKATTIPSNAVKKIVDIIEKKRKL